MNKHVESSRIFSDGEWMVESKESAIRTLTNAGVYPFESKNAAKQFTAKHNIKNYKYLPV
ncbi:hypothetical protein L1D14_07640 [Vibrio tubiashii]|uniref:hypothetical protein n=1 Tax=Vibrio tubiashii TaxID=29498 RepID=UPI001EFCE887|nr:hypothetical protein [Vibrio tubiashii]MCG9576111.1 hypothetical protein [Vibrio tubiashii]